MFFHVCFVVVVVVVENGIVSTYIYIYISIAFSSKTLSLQHNITCTKVK